MGLLQLRVVQLDVKTLCFSQGLQVECGFACESCEGKWHKGLFRRLSKKRAFDWDVNDSDLIFAHIDANGDSKISLWEYALHVRDMTGSDETPSKVYWNHFDTSLIKALPTSALIMIGMAILVMKNISYSRCTSMDP